jgi:energy-coupling factor transporter ATP-binding protein EcfA2
MSLVQAEKLEKSYRVGDVDVPAIRGMDFTIETGAFVAFVGPSGSGKSTLLNLLTWIAEYYRNGLGYAADELADFYRFADAALSTGGAAAAKAASLTQACYGRPNPGRDYLYLRTSAKEPFNWLYVTPALTAIVSLDDHSRSIAPELVYTGITNLELRGRAVFTQGERLTEFGEKPNRRRIEVYARWYF